MADLYNYASNNNIIFIGHGANVTTAYIAKASKSHMLVHADLDEIYDNSFASTTSEFLTESYDVSIAEALVPEISLPIAELDLSTPNVIMPGTSTVAFYLASTRIDDLEFGNQYTRSITYS